MNAELMHAFNWHPVERNTMRGFFSLRLPTGLVLHGCTLHQQHLTRWVGLPAAPQLDENGCHRTDEAGKKLYAPVVEIPGKTARERFRAEALDAVDRMLAAAQP